MKILRGLGLEARIRSIGFAPEVGYNREWDTGQITYLHPMGAQIEQRFGAPDISLHRAALHSALVSINPPDDPPSRQETRRHRSKRLLIISLTFADGGKVRGRCGHRCRRRPFHGAGYPVRRRRAPLYRPGSLPGDLSQRIARRRRSTTGSNGGDLTGTSSATRSIHAGTSSISSPARPSPNSRSNPGRRGATSTSCGRLSPAFIRMRGSSSTPVRRYANGRWSSAIRWHVGARIASC